jgi:hypothetical protein
VLGSRFVVRATGTSPSSPFTPANPGYLYASPDFVYFDDLLFARITTNLNAASIYTLDEMNGCALTDITRGGAVVQASPDAAGSGVSVTLEATDAQLVTSGIGSLVSPYQCTSDVTGLMNCQLQSLPVLSSVTNPETNAGVTVSSELVHLPTISTAYPE